MKKKGRALAIVRRAGGAVSVIRDKPAVRRALKTTIPLGIAVPMYTIGKNFYYNRAAGASYLISQLTGYDAAVGGWNWGRWKANGMQLLLGIGVHKVANHLGINRTLSRMGVPFIRL